MVLKLYQTSVSPPSRAVLMALEYLNLPVELVEINLFNDDHMTEEFLKLNPQHTIPVLVDDGFVLPDSHAICSYLVSKYAKDDSLYPKDPKARAIVDHRLHFDSGVLFSLLRIIVRPIIFSGVKVLSEEDQQKILSAYDFTEKFLTSTWIAGEQLTIADMCCVTSISTYNELLPVDAKKFPKLSAWFQRCSQLDIYKKHNAPGVKLLGDTVRKIFNS